MSLKETRDANALNLPYRDYQYTVTAYKKGWDDGVIEIEELTHVYKHKLNFKEVPNMTVKGQEELDAAIAKAVTLKELNEDLNQTFSDLKKDSVTWFQRSEQLSAQLTDARDALKFYAARGHYKKNWLRWFGITKCVEEGNLARKCILKIGVR